MSGNGPRNKVLTMIVVFVIAVFVVTYIVSKMGR